MGRHARGCGPWAQRQQGRADQENHSTRNHARGWALLVQGAHLLSGSTPACPWMRPHLAPHGPLPVCMLHPTPTRPPLTTDRTLLWTMADLDLQLLTTNNVTLVGRYYCPEGWSLPMTRGTPVTLACAWPSGPSGGACALPRAPPAGQRGGRPRQRGRAARGPRAPHRRPP